MGKGKKSHWRLTLFNTVEENIAASTFCFYTIYTSHTIIWISVHKCLPKYKLCILIYIWEKVQYIFREFLIATIIILKTHNIFNRSMLFSFNILFEGKKGLLYFLLFLLMLSFLFSCILCLFKCFICTTWWVSTYTTTHA